MPQNVPTFEWTDDALRIREFVFDRWFEHGHAPTLREMHEHTGLSRRQLVQALKLLQLGLVVVCDERTQNCYLHKAPPFASYPTNVRLHVDGRFRGFIGCAHEAVGISNAPQLRGVDLHFEADCACCLAPITLDMRDYEVVGASPQEPLIHVTQSPWDWCNVDMTSMCDATNFVLDADHASRYERMQSRRGVLFTLDQVRDYVRFVASERHWNYHWKPLSMDPEAILGRLTELGVDISAWSA